MSEYREIYASDQICIKLQASASIKMTTHFSSQHIESAAILSRKAQQMELEHRGRATQQIISEQKSYVTAAIFSAVSFLEANINELFWDSAQNKSGLKDWDYNLMQKMEAAYRSRILDRASFGTLEKYDLVLIFADKKVMDQGNAIYQNVKCLIRLRNCLIHYEPKWIDQGKAQELEKNLKGRFMLNPLVDENSLFFPHRCLSHDCAKWAVESCVSFTDTFYRKLNKTPRYETRREYLDAYIKT